jgi:hypothetical protein
MTVCHNSLQAAGISAAGNESETVGDPEIDLGGMAPAAIDVKLAGIASGEEFGDGLVTL